MLNHWGKAEFNRHSRPQQGEVLCVVSKAEKLYFILGRYRLQSQ